MVATVYGPERVNDPLFEEEGCRYVENGDGRIGNEELRGPE